MHTKFVVRPQSYQDSVKLMAVSAELGAMPDIELAAAVMGTDSNRATLQQGGFSFDSSIKAGPEDIIIAIRGRSEVAVNQALSMLNNLLAPSSSASTAGDLRPRSLRGALSVMKEANLAIISVPGDYAAAEAFKALRSGLNVMIFSDNVPVDEEIALKQLAQQSGLFVMGPDCGTAIINGTPLCFANSVAKGPIGIVGASGTGIQQATVLIDRLGSGISQAIGTGGRDLSDAVGGITTLMGIDALEDNPNTKVILVISKPPGVSTADKVLRRLALCKKPVVVAFSGAKDDLSIPAGSYTAAHLETAAAQAVALANDFTPNSSSLAFPREGIEDLVVAELAKLDSTQTKVRGLFSGGSLASEAVNILAPSLGLIYNNMSKETSSRMKVPLQSEGHCVIDMGDDLFTKGRPHPMIDPSYRATRLLQEYAGPDVAVILCDVVLGYGSHNNPAGALAHAVEQARGLSGRYVSVVASVCGTEKDPQRLSHQEQVLRSAGVVVLPSNAYAVEVAGRIALACSQRRKD